MILPRGELTLAELRIAGAISPSVRIILDMMLAASHSEQLHAVEAAIDFIAGELSKHRHLKQEHSEDELTIDIIIGLKSMGFQASHDTQYGGHCDVVIEAANNFLWIAEAKIFGDTGDLVDAFRQLTTRYSTGLAGQDCGEIIMYCKRPNLADLVDGWEARIKNDCEPKAVRRCERDPLIVRSVHTHTGSGLQFYIRHRPIMLHFSPQK